MSDFSITQLIAIVNYGVNGIKTNLDFLQDEIHKYEENIKAIEHYQNLILPAYEKALKEENDKIVEARVREEIIKIQKTHHTKE